MAKSPTSTSSLSPSSATSKFFLSTFIIAKSKVESFHNTLPSLEVPSANITDTFVAFPSSTTCELVNI